MGSSLGGKNGGRVKFIASKRNACRTSIINQAGPQCKAPVPAGRRGYLCHSELLPSSPYGVEISNPVRWHGGPVERASSVRHPDPSPLFGQQTLLSKKQPHSPSRNRWHIPPHPGAHPACDLFRDKFGLGSASCAPLAARNGFAQGTTKFFPAFCFRRQRVGCSFRCSAIVLISGNGTTARFPGDKPGQYHSASMAAGGRSDKGNGLRRIDKLERFRGAT